MYLITNDFVSGQRYIEFQTPDGVEIPMLDSFREDSDDGIRFIIQSMYGETDANINDDCPAGFLCVETDVAHGGVTNVWHCKATSYEDVVGGFMSGHITLIRCQPIRDEPIEIPSVDVSTTHW